MNPSLFAELHEQLEGEVRFDFPLARCTTYRIGGPATALISPHTVDDVVRVLCYARDTGTPWLVLGLGSNVLISDRGFDGIVLRIGKGLDALIPGVGGEPHVWSVGAGLPTPLLARRAAKAGLAGLHRLVGVPGTVGGGVFMNAGAHGQEYRQVVRRLQLVDPGGEVREVDGSDVAWRYRTSGLEGHVVVGATVALAPADPRILEREIQRHFQWRKSGTPFEQPCCGSVFRNPSPLPPQGTGATGGAGGAEGAGETPRTAGQLVDACGLKGLRIGGAEVSTKHANYIVNRGDATASDVRAVIDAVRTRVLKAFGVELALEVKVIGE